MPVLFIAIAVSLALKLQKLMKQRFYDHSKKNQLCEETQERQKRSEQLLQIQSSMDFSSLFLSCARFAPQDITNEKTAMKYL